MKKRMAELLVALSKEILTEKDKYALISFLEDKERWLLLFDEVMRNKMLSWLLYHLRKCELLSLIPSFYVKNMVAYDTITRYKLEMYLQIATELSKLPINICFMKGPILYKRLYGDSWRTQISRESNDLDVLILKKDLTIIDRKLNSMGYNQTIIRADGKFEKASREEQIKWKITTHQTCPYTAPNELSIYNDMNQNMVDINFSIFWGGITNDPVSTLDLLSTKREYMEEGGNKYNILGFKEELMQLLVHLYKDLHYEVKKKKNKSLCLINVIDLYYYLEDYFPEDQINDFLVYIQKCDVMNYVIESLKIVACLYKGKAWSILKMLGVLEESLEEKRTQILEDIVVSC